MRRREQRATAEATEVATTVAVSVPGVGSGAFEDGKSNSKDESEMAVKITITKEASSTLKDFVLRVNDGFDAGQVHRQDIASWVITKFVSVCTDQDVHDIRMSHYDDVSMFDALYRRAKETGEVPEFLREALKKHFGGAESNRKSKKAIGKGYISDVPLRNEDAT
jgi:hypothetical protein